MTDIGKLADLIDKKLRNINRSKMKDQL